MEEMPEVANMKFQDRIKLQALVIACAGALFFASSTFGQEIVNTRFDDGPNVVPLSQSIAVDDSTTASAASNEIIPAVTLNQPAATQDAAIPVEWVIPSIPLFLSLCFIAVYAFAKTKRSYSTHDAGMGNPNTLS
jgi:hypothetical protein